jgi:16S rRNA (guanine966-N2)-methyltransferase
MVEADGNAYRQLQSNAALLQAEQCQLWHKQAQQFLLKASGPFDIVFIDPPYQSALWSEVADLLVSRDLLSEGARIYLEFPRHQLMPALPMQWQLLKEKQAGDVKYCLFENQSGASE